uniref:Uncharacterized protein n=1 Tax=Rhizobium leguminosarum TaxID=384 RepID=A0A179B8G3_RHILE|nr:hypothetical protein A4U53_36185 [Rhizobium leguminosarum]
MVAVSRGLLWPQVREGRSWAIYLAVKDLEKMEQEADAICAYVQDKDSTLRSAAHVHALSRHSEAMEARGTRQIFTH